MRLLLLCLNFGGNDRLIASAAVPFLRLVSARRAEIGGRPEARLERGFAAAFTLARHESAYSTGARADACGTVGA